MAWSMATDQSTQASTVSSVAWVSADTRRASSAMAAGSPRWASATGPVRMRLPLPDRSGSAAAMRAAASASEPVLRSTWRVWLPTSARPAVEPGPEPGLDRGDRIIVAVRQRGEHGERHLRVVGPLPGLPPEGPAADHADDSIGRQRAARTRTRPRARPRRPTPAPRRRPGRRGPRVGCRALLRGSGRGSWSPRSVRGQALDVRARDSKVPTCRDGRPATGREPRRCRAGAGRTCHTPFVAFTSARSGRRVAGCGRW